MIELIVGAILGTIGSLLIAHAYYKKSSRELEDSITLLRSEIENLQSTNKELQNLASMISADTEVIRKHTLMGTIDDPEFPYK